MKQINQQNDEISLLKSLNSNKEGEINEIKRLKVFF